MLRHMLLGAVALAALGAGPAAAPARGATAPGGPPEGPPGGAAEAPAAGAGASTKAGEAKDAGELDIDSIMKTQRDTSRFYKFLGVYELHFNMISDDHSAADWLAFWMLHAKFDVSKHDQLSVRADLEQRFLADPGESGLYFGDMRFYYTRKFSIPIPDFAIPGQASIYLTAPTSRASRARSYITKPTLQVSLAPSWGPLSLIVTGTYQYAFAEYAESSERGTPNTRMTFDIWGQILYQPFDWFAPSFLWESTWTEPYPSREGEAQDWRNDYYFEFALNFSIPMPDKWPGIDLVLAYAQGASLLEDGVYRAYFAKRDQSELYFGLNVTY